MSHRVPRLSVSMHTQRHEALQDLEERVSIHTQRHETMQGLEERVRQLQKDLRDIRAKARAYREQFFSFRELVKEAWQGKSVAVAEVSRIVGVAPPHFTVPDKERGQSHLHIWGKSKVPCNWAPVTERAAEEPGAEGNSALAWLSAQAEERGQHSANIEDQQTDPEGLSTVGPHHHTSSVGINATTELSCSREATAPVEIHQKDEQGVTSYTGPILHERDQTRLEIFLPRRRNSSPDRRNYPGDSKDDSTDRKSYLPNRKMDMPNRKENTTDRKSYTQCRQNSTDRTNDNTDKNAKISQGFFKKTEVKTSKDGNGKGVAVAVGRVKLGIMRMWRTPSYPHTAGVSPGYLCDYHLDRKRTVFHREIVTPDYMLF